MKTILVDDMLLDLQLFELKCADLPDFEIVGKFTDPAQAVAYAGEHEVRTGKSRRHSGAGSERFRRHDDSQLPTWRQSADRKHGRLHKAQRQE